MGPQELGIKAFCVSDEIFGGWQWSSWGLELMTKEEFLKTSLVRKVIFLKHGDRTRGQEELPGTMRRDWLYTWESGEVKSRGSFQGDFHMLKTHRILEA